MDSVIIEGPCYDVIQPEKKEGNGLGDGDVWFVAPFWM